MYSGIKKKYLVNYQINLSDYNEIKKFSDYIFDKEKKAISL